MANRSTVHPERSALRALAAYGEPDANNRP
jgi:hypothetical protein